MISLCLLTDLACRDQKLVTCKIQAQLSPYQKYWRSPKYGALCVVTIGTWNLAPAGSRSDSTAAVDILCAGGLASGRGQLTHR